MIPGAALFGALALAAVPAPAAVHCDDEPVEATVARSVGYLLRTQREDGSWGSSAPECVLELGFAPTTYYAWQVASQGLACMALAAVPPADDVQAALERGVDWLCAARIPSRGSDWDVDHVWSALYGFVACVELLRDGRFDETPRQAALRRRCAELLDVLLDYQALSGGWAYYDDPPFDRTPTWATSFCTALVLPSLLEARELGFDVPEDVTRRAERYVRRCALPNGAYSYDLTPVDRLAGVEHINLVEGSLGRIQVCNWALARAGAPQVTADVLREGLETFFAHRAFLDHVRTRPIPHEGFHANAGYFYFFAHYYAALVVELLPARERALWHARLRPHLRKTQWKSGGASDFLDSGYLVTASTSYLILALEAGTPAANGEERRR